MDLEPESDNECSDSITNYVQIRNGGEAYSPVLWTGCGSNGLSHTIRSMANKLWIGITTYYFNKVISLSNKSHYIKLRNKLMFSVRSQFFIQAPVAQLVNHIEGFN